MSEIPFIGSLGDAIESAVTDSERRKRRVQRPHRALLVAVAVVVVGGAGVAVAQLGHDSGALAIDNVACYETADLKGDVSVLGSADGRSPISLCAEALGASGEEVPPLVACARGDAVVVLPGQTAASCRANDLDPLPAGYGAAREKVADLARWVAAIEGQADCVPPARLANAAQAVLDQAGWTGWRAVVARRAAAPCGWIRRLGGTGLGLGAAMRPDTGELVVTTGPPRSVFEQLFGPRSLGARLVEASGARCFTTAELREHARRTLAPIGLDVRVKTGRMPANIGIVPPRGDRYAEGCAISLGAYPVYPGDGRIVIEAEIAADGGSAASMR